MPNITENQFHWLTYRMGLENDEQTCLITSVDPDVLDEWKENPDFLYAYETALSNKREGFKYLITQLNGKALRKINDLLDDPSVKARVNGLNLLLRAQALLIDKQERVDPDAITRLIDRLRTPQPVITVSPGRPK